MKITDFEAQIALNGFADVDGTRVTVRGVQGVTEGEARAYIERAKEQYLHETITALEISPADEGRGNVSISYTIKPQPFQRIRRITGYLVGDMERWNGAKRAEEADRVKHSFEKEESDDVRES